MRRFEKRWNWIMQEYAYKDLETKEIYTKEDFFEMILREEIEIVNKDEDRANRDDPNKTRRYLS